MIRIRWVVVSVLLCVSLVALARFTLGADCKGGCRIFDKKDPPRIGSSNCYYYSDAVALRTFVVTENSKKARGTVIQVGIYSVALSECTEACSESTGNSREATWDDGEPDSGTWVSDNQMATECRDDT